MRDELRVSRPEIDDAVQVCLDRGALGARIVGGGFGGAVMALIPTSQMEAAADAVATAYAVRGYAAPRFCRWLLVLRRLMIGLRALILRIFRCCRVGC